ncbi:hypothetical protein [Geodermatophilus ruber]|nr:hypothetical protein [Geodermatophilus ruber]
MTTAVWIESLHNLHCPTCESRLVEHAGRFDVIGRPDPGYTADPRTLMCPSGHVLPDDQHALYEHRDNRGYPQEATTREVRAPR